MKNAYRYMKFKVFINSFQYALLITTIVLFDRVYRGTKIHALKFKFLFAFFLPFEPRLGYLCICIKFRYSLNKIFKMIRDLLINLLKK